MDKAVKYRMFATTDNKARPVKQLEQEKKLRPTRIRDFRMKRVFSTSLVGLLGCALPILLCSFKSNDNNHYLLIAIAIVGVFFFFIWVSKSTKKDKESAIKILNEHGLTNSELTGYNCTYVGGHPDQNMEATAVIAGAKKGKLIFFQGALLDNPKGTLFVITKDGFKHLFDIPIDSITGIRYFDVTTSHTIGIVGGNHFAVPINMKQGDASVLIDWTDEIFTHSTEFRITGADANIRANSLRNTLIKKVKDNKNIRLEG